MNLSPDVESEIRVGYAAIRHRVPVGMPAVVLHIGAGQMAIASGRGAEPDAITVLEIGSHRTSTEYFKHTPPTPIEFENAIMDVEDAVARIRTMVAAGSALFTADAAIGEIARMAGVTGQAEFILPLEAVESIFDRLAAITLGRPASQDKILASATFAATILILREFMHHLGFSSITVKV